VGCVGASFRHSIQFFRFNLLGIFKVLVCWGLMSGGLFRGSVLVSVGVCILDLLLLRFGTAFFMSDNFSI